MYIVVNQIFVVGQRKYCTNLLMEANCYDNAVAESLFSRFKAELLQNGTFLSIEDARTEIFEYTEIYYNRIRRHSALGYESPHRFEEKYYHHFISPASQVSH